MHSPSTPPFGFLSVCRHEPKILFSSSEESWQRGSKTQLCGQPSPGATCCFAPEQGETGAGPWPPAGHRAAMVSRQRRRLSRFAAAKTADADTTWLPNPRFPWGLEPWTSLCWPRGRRSWRPPDNSPSVWQPLLCLFMVLFSLINLKLVTFSSSLGCQRDAGPRVTSGEYSSGQLCLVPAAAVGPSRDVAASRSSGGIGSAWAG